MPLWRIFSHPQTFSLDQRKGIAKAVTDLYVSRGLPAFYVNVIFIDVDEKGTFIGGEQRNNFVRVVAEQIARAMPSPDTSEGRERRKKWMDLINEVGPCSPPDIRSVSCERMLMPTPGLETIHYR